MDLLIALLVSTVGLMEVLGFPAEVTVWSALLPTSLAVARFQQGRWQILPFIALAILVALFAIAGWMTNWIALLLLFVNFLAIWGLYLCPLPETIPPSGKYFVGFRKIDIPASAIATGDGMQTHLWYPTSRPDGHSTRSVFDTAEAAAYSTAMRSLGAPGFMYRHFRLARTHSYVNAPCADGSFPLVVFNHGGGMWPSTNFSLMEELASRGFIVASLAHPGESLAVAWNDGHVSLIDPQIIATLGQTSGSATHARFLVEQNEEQRRILLDKLKSQNLNRLSAATNRWSARSLEFVNWVEQDCPGDAATSALAHVDLSKLAYVGMSLGGSVAHECCHRDPRASAGINLDGMNWSFERLDQAMPTPFLQCYHDPTLPNNALEQYVGKPPKEPPTPLAKRAMFNDFYYSNAKSHNRVLCVFVRGAAHMGFTDLALATRGATTGIIGTGLNGGRERTVLINRLSAQFLEDALLSGSFAGSSTLISHEPGLLLQEQ